MVQYGLDLNFALTKNDGEINVGCNLTDSEGFKYSKEMFGNDIRTIYGAMLKDVMKEYTAQKKKLQEQVEMKAAKEESLDDEIDELIKENDALVDYIDELEAKIRRLEEKKACSCKKVPGNKGKDNIWKDIFADSSNCVYDYEKFFKDFFS